MVYTAAPVYEGYADQSGLVSEGHFIRYTKHLSETANHGLGLRAKYEIQKSGIRKNYFDKAKISEIEEKNILPCIFKKYISIQFK